MAPDPRLMDAVEKLDYRVTVGDIASQAGLDVKRVEPALLALASEAGGHLQVAETGEISYQFPRNFRTILRSKYLRLRLQEWWGKVWKILFYLIRMSFGVVLIASIILIFVAIAAILIALNASRGEGDNDSGGGGGMVFFPTFWIGPDWYWIFLPDYGGAERRRASGPDGKMSFLEAVYSFLFGDGNPNADLEERRWKAIANTIRNNRGAVVAEQIAPYLDTLGQGFNLEFEDYMLPVLSRFNGRPEVSPDGQLVYQFPELQVSAKEQRRSSVPAYLKETLWQFSRASSGQIMMAAALGGVNIIGALMLGALLRDIGIAGGLIGFVSGIYGLLLTYGIAFLAVPLIRYFWLKRRNVSVEKRNDMRQLRATQLNEANEPLQQKLAFAQQFAASTVIDRANLAYTTEKDLTEQELLNAEKIDEEWRRRLEQS
jgi:hypothetical protein